MPEERMAGGRVRVHTNRDGAVEKIYGKSVAGHGFQTLTRMIDMYGDYGVRQMGEDLLGRRNQFAAQRDGGYVYDPDSMEAYGNALIRFAQSLRRENAAYHEEQQTPATRA